MCSWFKMKSLFHYALIVGIFFFISFCINGIRSISNNKLFVICYDRWHDYSIVLIYDELLNEFVFFCFVFLINIAVGFRLVVIHRRSQRYIFLRRPCIRPSYPPVHPHFLTIRNHISVLICQVRIILCTNDMYHVLTISYKFRQNRPFST